MINEYRVYEPPKIGLRPVFYMNMVQAVRDLQTRLSGELAKHRVARHSHDYSFSKVVTDFCAVCSLPNHSESPGICRNCYAARLDTQRSRAQATHEWRLQQARYGKEK